MAERWYARLSYLFGHSLSSRQPLILYASSSDFQQTNVIEGTIGEGTGGVTEALKRRVVLPFAGPIAETDHVLGHELVHAFQYDIIATRSQSSGDLAAAARMPLWFVEGMAEYFSLGPQDPHTAMWMRDALARNDVPSVRQLENSAKYFPYRYGQALLAYIGGRWGDLAVGRMMKAAVPQGDLQSTIANTLAIDANELSRDWHDALEEVYGDLVAELPGPERYGAPLLETAKHDRPLSVGPSLSPDGKRLAFFSSRDLFSIELYVADTETGKVGARLTKTVSDPHFSSLGFIDSSGAWAPDGRRFAFAAVSEGRPHIAIVDVDRNRIEREIPLPGLGEAFTPTWSPDGKRLAFSAMAGGLMDLYIYDLESSALDRRTHDLFAELTPVWSPNGRMIAFVTDRFDAQPGTLCMGDYRLALLDVVTGQKDLLPGFVGAKNINPQWSPDGESLYFISDEGGISNVFRLDLDDGHIEQLTHLLTGVSGITELSPALSVATTNGKMAFGVYQNDGYDVYLVPSAETLSGSRVTSRDSGWNASMLPPQNRESLVAELLADAETGLPRSNASFTSDDYRARLSLDYVAQPFIVAGADPFGTYLGGGTALVFGDMLGDHQLTTLFQVQGGFEDIGGLVSYRNLSHRWNWGGVIEQVPYVTGDLRAGYTDVNGEPAYVEQSLLYRQTNTALTGVVSYPFNPVRRFDLSGGLRRVGFSEELRTTAYSLIDGAMLIDDVVNLPTFETLYLAQASAALVGDNSFFGMTSPILGERYRFEVAPYRGDIDFFNVVADYRRYFMPVRPYTIAGRVLHYGRYGSGSEDERLAPLYVGYPHLVRGYNYNTFSASECGPPTPNGGCPVYDQLLGTRMLVANLELRFPLFGAIRRGGSLYGPLPVEAAVFADAGVAWVAGDEPSFLGGEREVVKSVGTALRVNTFGFFIFELDFVKPLDRPLKGWHWMFNLISGF
jgi:Tol biopolymer transport system component